MNSEIFKKPLIFDSVEFLIAVKKQLIIIGLLIGMYHASAQSKFGVEVHYNVPVGLTSIPSVNVMQANTFVQQGVKGNESTAISTVSSYVPQALSLGLTYEMVRGVAARVIYSRGAIGGQQDLTGPVINSNMPSNYKSYFNSFSAYELSVQADLLDLITKVKATRLFSPQLSGGFGMVANDIVTMRGDGRVRSFKYTCFAVVTGAELKMQVIPSFSFTVGGSIYFTDTYYLDGIHKDFKKDCLLMPYIGISKNL